MGITQKIFFLHLLNDQMDKYNENETIQEFPEGKDPSRFPNRNDDNVSSNERAGEREGGGGGEGGSVDGGFASAEVQHSYQDMAGGDDIDMRSDISYDRCVRDEYLQGEEGAHLDTLEIQAHERDHRRSGFGIPSECLFPFFNLPFDSDADGDMSPGTMSMIVERNGDSSDESSEAPSMACSMMSHRSCGSATVFGAGAWLRLT